MADIVSIGLAYDTSQMLTGSRLVQEALEQSVRELLTLLDDEPGHPNTRHPGLSPEAARAIQDYQTARQEYAARQPTLQGWLPQDRSAQLVPVARRLERARERLIALQIDPATIEA